MLLPALLLALPETQVLEATLFDDAPATDVQFARDVALDGDTLVVGSRNTAVWVFVRSGTSWSLEQRLDAPGTTGYFGRNVALDGDTLAFLSFSAGPDTLHVWARQGTVWSEQATFDGTYAFSGILQGELRGSLSLSGDELLVQTSPPRLYSRTGTTWAESAQIPDASGQSHSLQGDRIAAGFPDASLDAGLVKILERSAGVWTLTQTIQPGNLVQGDRFGQSVALDGDFLAVGARDKGGSERGAVYLFERGCGAWPQVDFLMPQPFTFNMHAGEKVDLDAGQVALGSHGFGIGFGNGSAFRYQRNGATLVEEQELLQVGVSPVQIDGDTFVVGLPEDGTFGPNAGKVLVYRLLTGAPRVYCAPKVSTQCCLPKIGFAGAPGATDPNPFDVTATDVTNWKNGILFYGFAGRAALPFQGGLLCVTPPLRRSPIQNSGGNAPPANDCSGSFSIDLNALIQSGLDPFLVPGAQVDSQFWFREPADAFQSGLSDALEWVVAP